MKLLLHICCAPCSVACIDALRAEGIEPTGFWYNPNIHPFTEYRARRDALRGYAASVGLELKELDDYALREFVSAVAPDYDARCGKCYTMRLDETARYAAEHGYDAFSTTLTVSPYQDQELICAAAQSAAARCGVPFLYRDFRPLFCDGQTKARELGLYMQKYCGCIFSEEDRYSKKRQRENAALRAKNKTQPR